LPTGTIATTQSFGNSSTAIATTAFVQAAMAALFPVGAIYTAVVSTNPATLIGFGTWTAFGAGRVMVGFDSGNALFDTAEETGGSADAITVSHTHTATSTDSGHTHTTTWNNINDFVQGSQSPGAEQSPDDIQGTFNIATNSSTANITTTIASAGSSGTNANYQPYITVYMWKRTAYGIYD
jgi:hypothetical protein